MITKLILPDGSVLSSGDANRAAVVAFQHTASVTAGQELVPGGCCSAMVRVDILGLPPIEKGMELTVYRDENLLGHFTVHTTQTTNYGMTVTAYDRVTRLDRDLTGWLAERTGWPVNLGDLAREVCAACGLELAKAPDTAYEVEKFTLSSLTGRQLMQWIGEAGGCFCRARADGRLELSWFEQTDRSLGKADYYQDSLRFESHEVLPVEQVKLIQTSADVGAVWPQATEAVNTLLIRGNPLLAAQTTDKIEPVARALYERFSALRYTPCTVTVKEEQAIRPGDIITVDGKTVYVMAADLNQGRLRLSCTGSEKRSDSATVTISQKELVGRVLEIDTRIDGLTAENRDNAGRISRLSMTVDGLTAEVSTQLSLEQQRLSKLEQTAEGLSLQLRQVGGQVVTDTGYTFDADGLRIARSGTEMENRLDHSGMYVCRGGETILQANSRGVVAADVQVHNYLHVGSHARFEDYAGRTACFYIGDTQ